LASLQPSAEFYLSGFFLQTSVHFSCIARARANGISSRFKLEQINPAPPPHISSLRKRKRKRERPCDQSVPRFASLVANPSRPSYVEFGTRLTNPRDKASHPVIREPPRTFSRPCYRAAARRALILVPRSIRDNRAATTPEKERKGMEREQGVGSLYDVRHVGRRICIADEEVSSCSLNERGISLETRPPSSRRPCDKARPFHRPVKIVAGTHQRLKQRAAVPR